MGRRDFCLQNELVGSFLNNIDDDDMDLNDYSSRQQVFTNTSVT